MFMPLLIFASAIVIAAVLFQLGALSVWVAVLSLLIKAMLLIVLSIALYLGLPLAWRRYRSAAMHRLPKPRIPDDQS